ncbi:MAG: preprotein translocase subunit SecG [Verrucomicrobia bacterium]|nr:MAG: preprotein translocase subunit SecG [Verrucomicrobiota bacterium]
MAFFKFVMITMEMVCAFLLVGVILLQRTKSQGLGGLAFGQSMGESMFGSRAGNVLTKATIILGAIFLANTLFLGMTYANARTAALQSKSVMERQGLIPMATQAARPVAAPVSAPVIPTAVPVAPAPASAPAPVAPVVPAPAAK